jgi:transposase
MAQKITKKQYPDEFKEEAVALVNEQGYSVPEAAKALRITPGLLYRWKERLDAKLEGRTLSESERDELIRLRKENRTLLMEKEILKKASAFFAKEMK